MTGYKLVPVEPTEDMLVAGQEEWAHRPHGALEDCEEARSIYKAMLAAAPAVQEEPVSVADALRQIAGWMDDGGPTYHEAEMIGMEISGPTECYSHKRCVKAAKKAFLEAARIWEYMHPAQPAEQKPASRPWSYCPECGSEHVQHHEGEHKQCANCHQEWFSGTDYTDVVRKHLAGKFRDKDAEIERLRSTEFAQPAPDTLIGRTVSMDVSTADHNAFHRLFGTVVGVEGQAGVILCELDEDNQDKQSAPDVAGLAALLEHAQCPNCDGSGARYGSHGEPEQCQWCHERAEALAAHPKGGDV